MKTKFFIIILAVVILGEFFVLVGVPDFRSRAQSNVLEASLVPDSLSNDALIEERNRWSKIMDQIGPEKAYAEFKKQYADKNFGTQHLAAHIIGTLLYKKAGISGQAICDSTFSFGCYHSFFSQVLADKGPAVISKLDEVCLDKFGPLGSGCQHGIGHGVMDYRGPNHLLDALNDCKDTTASSEISGCTSGVFMEYNVPIIITDTSATPTTRPLDPKKPYEPCPSLPQNYEESCYYSIGQWWNQTDVYRDDWKAQGLLCKNAPDPTHTETCYLGIGNVVGPANSYDVVKSIESCKKMPDQRGIILCQAGTSWSFDANPDYRPLAIKMCDELTGPDQKECLRWGNLLNPSNK